MKTVSHYTLILLLAIGGLSACAVPERPVAPDRVDQSERILLAEIARSRGDADRAIDFYVAAAEHTESASLAREVTLFCFQALAWEDALAAARRWQALAPDSPEANWYLGRGELLVGRQAAAEQAFGRWLAAGGWQDWDLLSQQLQSEPRQWRALQIVNNLATRRDSAAAWEAVAEMALSLHRLESAATAAARALAKDERRRRSEWLWLRARASQDDDAALARAHVLAAGGDVGDGLEFVSLLWGITEWREALAFVDRAIEEQGEIPALQYARALLNVYAGRRDAAESDFHALVAQGFRVREAWYQLGRLAAGQGEHETALHWFDRVLSGSRELPARVEGIFMLLELGREAEAWERDELLSRRLGERASEYQLEMAAALAASGRVQAAETRCRALLNARFGNPDSYYRCGLSLLQADRHHRAGMEWLRQAQARWPEEPAVNNALGYSLVEQGRELKQARRLIDRALDKSPDSGAILDSKAWVEYRLGHQARALEWVERAWRREASPEVGAHVIELRWVNGQRDSARALYQSLTERWPDEAILEKTWRRLNNAS